MKFVYRVVLLEQISEKNFFFLAIREEIYNTLSNSICSLVSNRHNAKKIGNITERQILRFQLSFN